MGGRPTRPILYDTTRETRVVDGYVYFRDEEGRECGTYQGLYLYEHWVLERERFDQELNDWKDFRKDQQRDHEKQQMNGVTKIGRTQHLEQRPHSSEEQKVSELEWDRHEQELKDWKESRDAQRLANHSQQGKGAEKEVNLQQQEYERELRLTTSLTMLKD